MKLRFVISLFLLTIYKCDYDCRDISPIYESSCVLSDLDLKNSSNLRYCCYIEYDLYRYNNYYSSNYKYEGTYSKCMPYNSTGYDAIHYIYNNNLKFESYSYSSYKQISKIQCNYRAKEETNQVSEYCDDIEPEKASDCKFSYSESSYNKYCCYVKDSNSYYPYCKSYTKSEIDTKTSNYYSTSTSTSIFVCTSSTSYIKISILILLSLLL